MRRFLTILIVLLCSLQLVTAQKKAKLYTEAEEANAIYKNEWSIGGRMHTNGFSAFFERVWIKNVWKKNLIQANFFYFKDLKETRTKSGIPVNGVERKVFYGKQNNFFSLNFSYGQRKILARKADDNGVRISMTYMAGITLGFLKPYHLEFVNIETTDNIFYTGSIDDVGEEIFLGQSSTDFIVGPGGVKNGWNEIKLRPGVRAKYGFNFDWAKKEYFIKELELGAQLDVFYKSIEILANDRNKPFIFNLYLSLQFGKRW